MLSLSMVMSLSMYSLSAQFKVYILYRTHVTGAINHGYGVHCYSDLLTWPHDANLVINVLDDVILKRERLPLVLYLQLDNTARDKYVMAFLGYLVQAGVFKEVSGRFVITPFQMFFDSWTHS